MITKKVFKNIVNYDYGIPSGWSYPIKGYWLDVYYLSDIYKYRKKYSKCIFLGKTLYTQRYIKKSPCKFK